MGIMTTDPIADLLTRIRNTLSLGISELVIPHSKMRLGVLKVLKEAGYVAGVKVKKGAKQQIEVALSDGVGDSRRIKKLRRVSKPGRRVYVNAREIPILRGGQGLVVISTPQGIMSGHRARARHLGGEIICEVW